MADSSSYFNFYRVAQQPARGNSLWFINILRALVMLLLMTLLTDLLVVLFWPDGLQVLKNTYTQEIQYLSANIDERTAGVISSWVNTAYDWSFVKTGIHHYLYSGGNGITSSIISGVWPAFQGSMIGFQIFIIRLSVIVLMLPFLLLMMIIGATDGYLQWYLRRTSGARESAFIYHRSKRIACWSLFGFWFLYLVPPFSIDPAWIFIPSILLIALFTRLTVQYFKKYV